MRPVVRTRRRPSRRAAPEGPQHRREHTRKMSAVSYSLRRANGSAGEWCCQFATSPFLPRMGFLTGLVRPAITAGGGDLMRSRYLVKTLGLLVAVVLPMTAAAQTSASSNDKEGKPWTAPRTPWGDPDI